MRTLLIIFILKTSFFFGQENDSTIYNIYKTTKNVIDVKYFKAFHSNGKLKVEGWIVYELASSESEIIEIKDWDKGDTITHRFGIWKWYDGDGLTKIIDSIGKYKSEVYKSYQYYPNGCIALCDIIKPLLSIEMELITKGDDWMGRKKDDIEWMERSLYSFSNCNVIKREAFFLTNNVKSGTWKWYKKGKLVKTKEYKDNKLIASKKYRN